jgi:UDP-glucuronate decarboxylase
LKTFFDTIVKSDLTTLHNEVAGGTFSGKKMLVTGGAGFLGSWLCDFLAESKALVDCVDDQSTGLMQNVDHLIGKSNFNFQKLDVTKGVEGSYDTILHLASHASPDEYQRHPIETLLVNSQGTQGLLELARKNDALFLYSSTSEIYGNALIIPTPESYWGNVSSIGPRSCYDEGKRFGEALIMAYYRAYGLDVRIVRIFNTYGPRLRADGFYGRALSRFIGQALSGSDITVHGNGEQTRSFCYVTDTVRAMLLTLNESRMKGEVVNVGSPHEVTILELAEKIKAITQSSSKITFQPRPVHDPQRRLPLLTRAKGILGWSPSVELDEGLRKTIEGLGVFLMQKGIVNS